MVAKANARRRRIIPALSSLIGSSCLKTEDRKYLDLAAPVNADALLASGDATSDVVGGELRRWMRSTRRRPGCRDRRRQENRRSGSFAQRGADSPCPCGR